MKIVSIVGARPQFIKASVVSEALQEYNIKEVIVNSGQHYDFNMSDVFFQSLKIPEPKYNLEVGSGTHAEMTAKIMIKFEPVLLTEKPDFVLVYGDTNTTLAGALVAAKLKIPVAHVEAGIRMHPKDMPEEINRVLVDKISSKLFCASKRGLSNLQNEGITEGVIFAGDVMYDVFLKTQPYFRYDCLKEHKLDEGKFVVVTLHRDYNVDSPETLATILYELQKVSKEYPVIFPVHPRTKKRIAEFSLKDLTKDLILIEPLGYLEMMGLIKAAKNIITDSGGLQKESYFAGKQALVVMPDTGWQELIDLRINLLTEPIEIFSKWKSLNSFSFEEGIYGMGNAAEVVARSLLQ
ncbi:MAG: UDP-N-acetylglucosamine 2-epimerase (non-hydrolyzing) [Chitinophagales bacterium]|nr:UDP-N-acetylglucosamine 2-epimerase (non-hydrolyzing) [Chitinophagales bacterium]MDW8273035.1 UDP-N-acetylglucosamine 2-epimerase (non-hydrolyzing) [Chitinophagales bacterium]